MYTEVAMFILVSIMFLCYYMSFHAGNKGKCKVTPTYWPVVGMMPGLIINITRIHEYVTDILVESGTTFLFKGPVLTNLEMLLTCDPANVNYVLTKNFGNFPKGPEFKKMFDFLGDGIFNAEAELWENQRRITKLAVSHVGFQAFVATTTWNKTETGLIPFLKHASDVGIEVDLQEVFQRFTFDVSCILVLGHDPASLCQELPDSPCKKAFVDAEEAVLYRHVLPEAVWKMQKWLGIGREKKLSQAIETIDQYLFYCIALKHGSTKAADGSAMEDLDMLTSCMKLLPEGGDTPKVSEKVLKDLMLNFIFAGKDGISTTLTWFFWLLAANPAEEEKIRNEIETYSQEHGGKWRFSDTDALNKLVYLHGAVCETLRLFPPIAIQHKAPLKPDILPSGDRIKPNTKTLLSFYSMGRTESIWGKDCLQFKPGRWISDGGRVKVEPSYKFTAFNAGPRSCLGKEISFIQVKIAAAAMVSRFRIDVADAHPPQPSASIILHMKHGLNVKVSNYV